MYLPPPKELPPRSTVDCYIRDSGGDRQDESTRQQLAQLQAYCAQHNLILRRQFVDEARSGGTTAGRDAFNAMIDLYRRPDQRPHGLLIWNYARFARDLNDAIYYKALLRNRSIIVHSLTDPIPEGQYGRIIEFFIDISNEEKRRQTSTDAKRGLHDLVQKYGCVPGTPPRGFKRQPVTIGTRRDGASHIAHRWVPDPDLIPRLKLAFQLKAQGSPLSEIHKQTRLYIGINSYRTLFTNQLFIGILHFGELVIENYCPPIIDMPTWNAVQKRIETHSQSKRDRHHPRRAHSPYILSGLVYCAQCGSPLSANTVTTKGRNEAYRCSRAKRRAGCTQGRIGRRKLETAVLNTLDQYILLPEILEEMLKIETASTDHIQTKKDQQLKTHHAEKRTLNTQIANLTRAIAARGHSQALLDKLNELENRLGQVKIEIHELNEINVQKPLPLTREQIITLSSTLREKLNLKLPEQVRTILLSFIHEIRVRKNDKNQIEGTITYYLPSLPNPPPFETPLPASAGSGYNLPIKVPPLGAHLYRQTYTHPIKQKPRR